MNPFGNAAKDLKEYLGTEYKECDGALEVAKEWNRCHSYAHLKSYMYDLAQWHDTKNRKGINTQTLNILKRNGIKEVMDLGAGICSDAIAMAQEGLSVSTADFASPYYEFGKWRIKKYAESIPGTITSRHIPEWEEIGNVECILMIDTLEHIVDYKEFLGKTISGHTSKIVEKTPFGYHKKDDAVGDKYPLHTYYTRREVYAYLQEIGFKMVDKSGPFGPKLWVKNYARPQGTP